MEELGKPMYYNAKSVTIGTAKLLRKNMTFHEKLLWKKLKGKQILNLRFRRQHPIDFFIADFYCHQVKLVIELDGEIHINNEEYDEGRTAEMRKYGINVIRFSNFQVESNIDKVLDKIKTVVKNLINKPDC